MNRIHRPSPTLSNQSVLSQSIHPTVPPILPTPSHSLYIYLWICMYLFPKRSTSNHMLPSIFWLQKKKQQHVIYVKALH